VGAVERSLEDGEHPVRGAAPGTLRVIIFRLANLKLRAPRLVRSRAGAFASASCQRLMWLAVSASKRSSPKAGRMCACAAERVARAVLGLR
jgi:hypothetical protein